MTTGNKNAVSMVEEEFNKLSPITKRIIQLVLQHGGDMRHGDIVKSLPAGTTDADIAQAFRECRESSLIWDKLPTPTNQVHTWNVSPTSKEEVAGLITR